MFLLKLSSFGTKILNYLPAEFSHFIALKSLKTLDDIGIKLINNNSNANIKLLGLSFKNKLGLAGGLDKNGDYIDCLSSLGFGFLEIGTVTPVAQPGNTKPRLYRDKDNNALINNMGFNNKGVDYLIEKLKSTNRVCPIAISIGKNKETPINKSIEDYILCFKKSYPVADFITINISSPNTEGLRELSSSNYLPELIQSLESERSNLLTKYGHKPLVIKISPNISLDHLDIFLDNVLKEKIDGLIATNTSSIHDHFHKPSGISGEPLFDLSTSILKRTRSIVGPDFPIIASGGVMSPSNFKAKLDAGADLVQLYSGLIYSGPMIIKDILENK